MNHRDQEQYASLLQRIAPHCLMLTHDRLSDLLRTPLGAAREQPFTYKTNTERTNMTTDNNNLSVPIGDMLHNIFVMQEKLNERIGVKTATMNNSERQTWVLAYCRAMTQELEEFPDCVPWKWWARYPKFDKQDAVVEVVDMLHFLVSLALVLGLKAEDVYNCYMQEKPGQF